MAATSPPKLAIDGGALRRPRRRPLRHTNILTRRPLVGHSKPARQVRTLAQSTSPRDGHHDGMKIRTPIARSRRRFFLFSQQIKTGKRHGFSWKARILNVLRNVK